MSEGATETHSIKVKVRPIVLCVWCAKGEDVIGDDNDDGNDDAGDNDTDVAYALLVSGMGGDCDAR